MCHDLQWGELSKRPQAGAGGMPDLALQLRVSKNALRSPAFQEEIVSQVLRHACASACNLYKRMSVACIFEVQVSQLPQVHGTSPRVSQAASLQA